MCARKADVESVEDVRGALHGKADATQLTGMHDSITASLHEVWERCAATGDAAQKTDERMVRERAPLRPPPPPPFSLCPLHARTPSSAWTATA